jgi:hypothetical protein
MDVNEDFVDIVACLEAEGAEFLIVGAYALAAHGFPRMTGDIDIFVRPTLENSARVYRALLAFGAPVVAHGVTERDFQIEDNIYQMGLPPRRIDIMTSVSGVSFDEASAEAIEGKLGDVTVRFIGKAAQARNKRAAGRPRDLVDAALLEADD